MAKILHTADFHLDSAFTALPEEKARLRRQEARQLTDRLVDYANDHGVELLLLAGDLFDSDQLYGQTAQELARSLARFRGHAVIAPGNHDFYAASSPYARLLWPENVHIFREERLQRLPFPQYGCVVYGAAFTAPAAPAGIPGSLGPEDEGLARILLLHGEVGVRDSRYRAMTLKDVEQSGADYLALGHVHAFGGVQQAGRTFWAYPGCPEGRGFDELGDKGVLYVEAEPGSCRAEFVPLCRRRYQILSVDVTGAEDLAAAVRAALPPDTAGDIYRILLTGERGAEALDLEGLTRALAPRFYGLTLRDRTRVQRAVWDRMEEDTLTGLFLRLMAARCRAEPENEILQQAVRFGTESLLLTHMALLVLMIAVVALYPAFPKDALQAQGGGERPHSILYILKSSRPFTLTLVSLFFTLAAIMPIVSFMVNLVSDRGGDEGHLGLALFLMGASELPAALLFTPLFRRFGAAGTLRMSICFMAVKPLLFLLAPGLSGLLLVQPVQLLGYGLFTPASVYYANANVFPVDQVKGQSIMMIASNGLGAMFGNFLAGYAIDWGGADAMLGMCLVFGVIGVLFMLAAGRSKT